MFRSTSFNISALLCLLACHSARPASSATSSAALPGGSQAGGSRPAGVSGLFSSPERDTWSDGTPAEERSNWRLQNSSGAAVSWPGVGLRKLHLAPRVQRKQLVEEVSHHASGEDEDYYTCIGEGQNAPHSEGYRPVGRLYEQLSKARLHLAEVVALARVTGRTLVLPTAGNSMLGTAYDYRRPLCVYFDVRVLGRAVHWVTEAYFLEKLFRNSNSDNNDSGNEDSGYSGSGNGGSGNDDCGQGNSHNCDHSHHRHNDYRGSGGGGRGSGGRGGKGSSKSGGGTSGGGGIGGRSGGRESGNKRATRRVYSNANEEESETEDWEESEHRNGTENGMKNESKSEDHGGDDEDEGREEVESRGAFTLFLSAPQEPCNATVLFKQAGRVDAPEGAAVAPRRATAFVRTGVTGVGPHACSSARKLGSPQHPLALLTAGVASHEQVVVFVRSTPLTFLHGEEFRLAARHLVYPGRLATAARRFAAARLGKRFLAVHWRTEKSLLAGVPPTSMARCARGLIASARSARKRLKLTGVFLATDLPRGNESHSRPVSHSFAALHPDKRHLAEALLKGILDKLVCARAYMFLHPPPYCYGVPRRRQLSTSSFTREILELRHQAGWKKNSNQIWFLR
eukprot:jgi/Mesen1/3533/ME000197S02551